MRILIAGSSGFLGQHLAAALRQAGHEPIGLVRRPPGADQIRWDPDSGHLDVAALDGVDAVVNLAGSPTFGNPHSRSWARELRRSRVQSTRVLAAAIADRAAASGMAPAFLAGNGISYYGDHGDAILDEGADSRGEALLTEVTRDWQAATQAAVDAGSRVAILRTSPVLDAASPPLQQLRLLFKAGLGGRLGRGDQYFPIISLRDWVGAVVHVVEHDLAGPVNLVCPVVPTNAEFTQALGRALGRPTVLPVPAPVIKVAAGPMAPELLGSVRAQPKALMESGYSFADADVTEILRTALG